jgi:hypothetical protein
MKLKLELIIEERPGGDVVLGVVHSGSGSATPRELAYGQQLMEVIWVAIPYVVKTLKGKEIIVTPAPSSKN